MAASYDGNVPFVEHRRVPRGTRWRGTFPYHLLSLTLAGGAVYDLPGGRVDLAPGDLLHFAPGAEQDWRVDAVAGWRVGYLIVAVPAALLELLPEPTLAPGIGRIRLDAAAARRIAQDFREMQEWCGRPTPLRSQLVLNLLEHVLLRLRSLRPAPEADARIARARDFLHASLEAPVVLADVARAAGLSRARLCALARQHLGAPPMAYLERLRLEQAARRLLFTADPIDVIAERLGYAERGYFDKRFKRRWGMTPRAYRRGGGVAATDG